MELYDRGAKDVILDMQMSIYVDLEYANLPMAATLDMQISWFSNSTKIIHQKVFKKRIAEVGMNIDDWREFTSILNMQISPWLLSWICIIADFLT